MLFVALFLGLFLLRDYAEQRAPIQTVMESVASLLALTVGVTGMVRFYSLLNALEQAKLAAEEANRTKSRFLATTSHEIRSPMYVIMGMTGLALKTELSSDQREYLEAVQVSADALLKVIDDILDFSKMETGGPDLHPAPFNLRESLDRTIKPLAVRAQGKGLELTYNIGEAVPSRLLGEWARLRQVVTNLVDNSIKFTQEGGIVLLVDMESQESDEVCLRFTVTDTGIGVPIAKQQMIFEPFVQADSSTSRSYGGTGLGLTIAKQLVEKMGGRLWVESQDGHGSTFRFTVRLARQGTHPILPPVLPSLSHPKFETGS